MPQPVARSLLEDIIRFHNEGNSVDFKAIQYKKEKFPELIKDVIAMANSFTNDDRYIISGVKLSLGGGRSIHGITDEAVDAAVYQQLIYENVEPELAIDYFPFALDGKQLMIFRISNCTNPPYLMRKAYDTLAKGDGFIRKGSHQTRLTRSDLDRIYATKVSSPKMSDQDITIVFERSQQDTLVVESLDQFTLPSQAYQAEIRALLELKRSDPPFRGTGIPIRMWYEPKTSYDDLDIQKLEFDLGRAEKAYGSEDHNWKFGELGIWINFIISNKGSDYVKDASVEITVPLVDGMELTTRLYSHPYHAPAYPTHPEPSPGEYKAKYPALRFRDNQYVLFQDLGELKRFIPCNAFRTGFSLFLPKSTAGTSLSITCTLYGQNLIGPIQKRLVLDIGPKGHETS